MFLSTINYFLSIFKGAEFATTPIPPIITFFGTLINVHRARSVVDDVPRTPIQSCVMTIFMSLAGHTFMSLLIDMRPSWVNTDMVIIFHIVAWYLLRFPKFYRLVEKILVHYPTLLTSLPTHTHYKKIFYLFNLFYEYLFNLP